MGDTLREPLRKRGCGGAAKEHSNGRLVAYGTCTLMVFHPCTPMVFR